MVKKINIIAFLMATNLVIAQKCNMRTSCRKCEKAFNKTIKNNKGVHYKDIFSFYERNKPLLKLAEKKHLTANYYLAENFLYEKHIENAIEWHKKGDLLGEFKSTYKLAKIFYDRKDYEKFLHYAKKSRNEIYESRKLLGDYYFQINDFEKALKWYIKSKDNSNSTFYNLGLIYQSFSNNKLATEYFLKSAKLQNPYAMILLGIAYKNGLGVVSNNEEAKYWLTLGIDSLGKNKNPENNKLINKAKKTLMQLEKH